jgi:hypothetical protein
VIGSALVAVLALGACSDDTKHAADLCTGRMIAGETLRASYPTNVDTVRNWDMGGVKPAVELWKNKPGDQFAAWCWYKGNGTDAMVSAVSADGGNVIFATGTTTSLVPTPDGP